jgi:hypothetical protein
MKSSSVLAVLAAARPLSVASSSATSGASRLRRAYFLRLLFHRKAATDKRKLWGSSASSTFAIWENVLRKVSWNRSSASSLA